jgi:hypothetical protein
MRTWRNLIDLAHRFKAVSAPEPQIKQNHVWLQFPTLLNCFQAIPYKANNLGVRTPT